MQDKIQTISDFLVRTDAMALHLNIPLNEVAERIGISKDMLMGYRTGRYPITAKAMAKLSKAEKESGFNVDYLRDPERFASPLKLAAEIAKKVGDAFELNQEQRDIVFNAAERVLTPALLPSSGQSFQREIMESNALKLLEIKEALEVVIKKI